MDIDFVVLWVDGNDPEWQAEKAKYQGETLDDSNSVNRFRDWGLMPYWFRAIERFTPWVRKIHFVTCGHVPSWLNTDHPKLNHVRHSDYIPAEYLPTFSANTIEMNVHRIPDLAEHFVFFNDDTFLLRPMEEGAFFRDGLPCTYGGEVPVYCRGDAGIWPHLVTNDLRVVNNHFPKRESVKKFRNKYIHRAYRWKDNIRTLAAETMFPEAFLGFKYLHAPSPFRKQTFEEIWREEPELLHKTCMNRFRSNDDVNQWMATWWQVASGQFSPYAVDNVIADAVDSNIKSICRIITSQSHDMICINDILDSVDFDTLSKTLKNTFEQLLPAESSFEKKKIVI